MALGANGEEERSLRDDLAASLKEIEEREAAAQPDDEQPPTPEAKADPEPAEPQADRGDGRDAHGRFIAKPKEGESSGPETDSAEQKDRPQGQAPKNDQFQPEKQPQAAEQTDQGATDAAPKSWRSDEAQAWKDTPPAARAAILRREAEAARLAGANDSERMFGREMADIFRPHVQEIQAAGANPQTALRILLDNHNALRSNDPQVKLSKARELLASYGIPAEALAQPDPNAPPPHVLALQNQIAQLERRLSNPQGQQFAPLPPSAEESTIAATIEAFRTDPAHPHFDAVKPVMGQLLETGAAPDLESAYHAAVAMTPALRSTVTPTVPAANPAEKTAAARQAAASVTGSPGPTGNPKPQTLRDELREQMRSAGFGV